MNDTHPTIAVAELTRLLVDVEGLPWEQAWGIVIKVRRGKARQRHSLLKLAQAAGCGVQGLRPWAFQPPKKTSSSLRYFFGSLLRLRRGGLKASQQGV